MVDLTIATVQLKAFSRSRGSRGLPEYTYFHGIDGVATPARARKRRSKSGGDGDASERGKMSRCRARRNAACESVEDALKSVSLEPSPQMPVDEQVGPVLSFTSTSAVPSASGLAMIFCQFGPIREASAKNSDALVVFKKREHAEEAFARTATIRAISSSLISFHLTHSLPPATTDPPVRERREEGSPGC
jgi:hypothetical protein